MSTGTEHRTDGEAHERREPYVAAGSLPGAAARVDHWFPSGGDRCAAWYYPATSGEARPPLVVMGHGLGGTRHMRLDAYARAFQAAGISALVFDYRGFGDSEGSPRQIVNVGAQLADWHAALAFARSGALPSDPSRVAIWGTSFGGGHVMRVAADDGAVAGVVSQCPFTDGIASVWRRFLANPVSSDVLFVLAIVDALRGLARRGPLLVPMAGTSWLPAFLASRDSLPGAAAQLPEGSVLTARSSRWLRRFPRVRARLGSHLALSDRTAPDGRDSVWGVAILPSGATVRNAIAARLVLTLAAYRPGRALRRTGSTPVLVCVCDGDTVAPPGPTVRATRGLPNVELRRYDAGHFDIYLGERFLQASADQAAFLARVLAVEGVPAR